MGLFGILAALGLLIWLAYRGWSDGAAWFASNKPLRVKPAIARKGGLSLLLMRVTDKGAGASPLAGIAWGLWR